MTSLITSAGLDWLNQLSFGSTSYTTPNRWEIGNDDTTPSESDTSCLGRVPYTYSVIDACDAITGWNHAGDGGQAVLNTDDEHLGSGCLNLPISYSSGVSSWTKTVSSKNLSGLLTGVYLWLYVNDLTNVVNSSSAVIITLGTGGVVNSEDYYFARSSLTAGVWNCLRIPDLTDSDNTNGSGATLNNVDTVKITVNTTGSFTGSNLRMDEWVYATDAEHEKTCEASYPIINVINHTVKWQIKYTSANSNGFTMKRLFLKNTSDFGYLTSTFADFEKSSAKELRIFVIQRLVNA